jgi:ABC-type multidrug transport system fused ATPase/permease subunit
MRQANEGWKDVRIDWTKRMERTEHVPIVAPYFSLRIDWSMRTGRTEPIRIVAPCFSGSQATLIGALRQWQESDDHDTPFEIFNGSATELRWQLFGQDNESTVIPNEVVTLGVLRYLAGCRHTNLDSQEAQAHKIDDRVAILREANTGFGAQSKFSQSEFRRSKLSERDNPYKVLLGHDPIDLPFPISISQLAAQGGKPAVVLPRTDFVEPKLPVRDLNHLDAVPPYDPESAASTAGHSLRAILTTIEQTRVRYVGIVATDARDVVFLTRLLRTQCPNVRVFTTEASVAFLHPEESVHLRGMVVGSTYPLAPVTQDWARTSLSPSEIVAFPTQSSQGYYNAVLAQFGRHDLMLGYHPPLISNDDHRQDQIRRKKSNEDLTGELAKEFDRPPIWISVVGQGGRLVPVHCYTEYDDRRSPVVRSRVTPEVVKAYDDKAEDVRPPRRPVVGDPLAPAHRPVVFVPVGVLLRSVGSVGALAVVILALAVPWFWRKGAAGLTQDEVAVEQIPESGWVEVWRGVMLAGILLFALPYALPVQEVWDACCAPQNWRHWFVVGAAVLIVVQVGIILAQLLWRFGAALRCQGAESARGYLGLLVVAVIAVGLALWWGLSLSRVERFFLYVRATDLTAGMSPITPMSWLGTAVFVLGFCGLRQADLARRVRLKCPFGKKSWRTIADADQELNNSLKNPLVSAFGPRAWIVLLALGLPFLLCAAWNIFEVHLPSAEGEVWDWIVQIIFWAAAAAVVLTLVRFLVLWSQLGELLGRILRVPMVGAFERLPDEIGRLFGGYLYAMEEVRRRHLAVLTWMLPHTERKDVAKLLGDDYQALQGSFERMGGSTGATTGGADDRQLAEAIRKKAADYLTNDLPDVWVKQWVNQAFGVARAPEGKDDEKGKANAGKDKGPTPRLFTGPAEPDPARQILAEKETFVAAVVVLYLGQFFAQLRQLVWALVFVPPLLLFAAASYPFQPDRPRLTAVIALLGAAAAGIVYVLYRINRDGLVSRVTRTTPGRFTLDSGFLSSLAAYVLPIVAVLALQVLGLFRFVVEPLLGLLQ